MIICFNKKKVYVKLQSKKQGLFNYATNIFELYFFLFDKGKFLTKLN